ncbi:hypothetical protein [Actinoplanes awajinensis]|uniref:Uncharacterized protein n=1 Tax=Actinoplanes awajinensis subsp. mycoplanecinus TaxID=135947 RepID=A0A117MLE5_9ACTN|nr:hypothetical protein [Actinoplanes awajinensis]KUL23694.1 hypothetical protein ADL15_45290 [Actinoplanes awajinensis subsp. mycoplanecinus]
MPAYHQPPAAAPGVAVSGTDGGDGWITVAPGAAVLGYGALRLRGAVSVLLSAMAVLCAIALAGTGVVNFVGLHSGQALMAQVSVGPGRPLIILAGLVGALAAARAAHRTTGLGRARY